MSLDTSEILPYVIGTLLLIALIKWLFSKVDDRPFHSPSLFFSYNPDPDSITELQNMFPNIPRSFIVRELDRCDGVVQLAIDKLILISPDFMDFRGLSGETGQGGQGRAHDHGIISYETSPAITRAPSTHHNLLNFLKTDQITSKSQLSCEDVPEKDYLSPSALTRKNWDKIDSSTRQRIMLERKKEMLMKAREIYTKKN